MRRYSDTLRQALLLLLHVCEPLPLPDPLEAPHRLLHVDTLDKTEDEMWAQDSKQHVQELRLVHNT